MPCCAIIVGKQEPTVAKFITIKVDSNSTNEELRCESQAYDHCQTYKTAQILLLFPYSFWDRLEDEINNLSSHAHLFLCCTILLVVILCYYIIDTIQDIRTANISSFPAILIFSKILTHSISTVIDRQKHRYTDRFLCVIHVHINAELYEIHHMLTQKMSIYWLTQNTI